MSVEHLVVAVAGTLAVGLHGLAFVQIKRAFPKRANWLVTEVILTAVGATTASAVAGYGPVLWATAPACVALVCFIAGKGSVTVLIRETDEETGEETPMPAATAEARRRFGVILTVAVTVLSVGSVAFGLV